MSFQIQHYITVENIAQCIKTLAQSIKTLGGSNFHPV